MKNCEEFSALLDLFVDGELAPDDMVRVQEHLDACPECRNYVDDLLAIRAAFPSVEDTVVPDGFAGDVMERIRAGTPKKAVSVRFRRWMGAAAALAACCAIVAALRMGPVGMGGGMDAGLAVATADSAAQTEAACDMEAESQEKSADETVDDAGMDSGEPEEFDEAVQYTSGAAPAEEAGNAKSNAQAPQTEPQRRNAVIEDAAKDKSAMLETFADVPSYYMEDEAPAGDTAPADTNSTAENGGNAEAPVLSFAPVPAPTAPAAASAKAAEPDLVLTEEEAGGLLDAFTPAEDNGTERTYLLSRDEFAALQEELPVEFQPEEGKEILTIVVTAA